MHAQPLRAHPALVVLLLVVAASCIGSGDTQPVAPTTTTVSEPEPIWTMLEDRVPPTTTPDPFVLQLADATHFLSLEVLRLDPGDLAGTCGLLWVAGDRVARAATNLADPWQEAADEAYRLAASITAPSGSRRLAQAGYSESLFTWAQALEDVAVQLRVVGGALAIGSGPPDKVVMETLQSACDAIGEQAQTTAASGLIVASGLADLVGDVR